MAYFLAVDLPHHIKLKINKIAFGIMGVNWIPMENYHITLKYFGGLKSIELEGLKNNLRDISFSPFHLAVKGVGHFGNKKDPRVLWTGIEKNEEIFQLKNKVDRVSTANGFLKDKRKFQPHITLAHLKNIRYGIIANFIQTFSLFKTESFKVKEITLFSVQKSQERSFYIKEQTYPIKEDSFLDVIAG